MWFQTPQPRGFYVVSFGELCERFSYYGAQTILVLYLTKALGLTDSQSYTLYGAYAAFAYALPLLGGAIADRLLGIKQTVIIGGILLILGNVLMALSYHDSFFLGLALTAFGIGLYKPNSTSLVGKLYENNDAKRESGFTLFYMGMNIGATASPFVYGFAAQWNYRYCYLISATILFISWILFLINLQRIVPVLKRIPQRSPWFIFNKLFFAYLIILIACILVSLLFINPSWINPSLLAFSVIALLALFTAVFKRELKERKKLFALIILSIFGMIFFAASLQVGSSINLFIQRDVNLVFLGWQIPAVMFTSLYPLAVILFAPFTAALWSYLRKKDKDLAVSSKFALGLLLVSFGFLCFSLAALNSKVNPLSHLPLIGILIGNLALGLGELCLMPAMFAAISRLAPANMQGTMMGVWFLFIAFGGYLSSFFAKLSVHNSAVNNLNEKITSSTIYSQAFIKVSAITIFIAGLLLAISPWIKSLMNNDGLSIGKITRANIL